MKGRDATQFQTSKQTWVLGTDGRMEEDTRLFLFLSWLDGDYGLLLARFQL